MSILKRINGIGLKKGSVWGTAVEPTTGDGLRVTSHTQPIGNSVMVDNADEFGVSMTSAITILEKEDQSGTMECNFYYDGGLEPIIASLMGMYGATVLDSYANKHNFVMKAGEIDEIFHTIAWDEGESDYVKVCPSVKFNTGTISYDNGLKLSVGYMADTVSIAGAFSTPLGITYQKADPIVPKLCSATVWVNAQSDGALDSGDAVNPSGVEIVLERGYITMPIQAGSCARGAMVDANSPMATVTLTFPRNATVHDQFWTAYPLGTRYKMSITFYGATIPNSSEEYTISLIFPELFQHEVMEVSQDTPQPTTIKFKALLAASAPTGMTYRTPYGFIINDLDALVGYPVIA